MRFQLSLILIAFMLCAIAMQSTSKYEGVSWNAKRNLWQVESYITGKKRKYYFGNEFDAAKHLNNLCEKIGMPLQNPTICKTPNQHAKEKSSQYKGVSYDTHSGKWNAQICPKGQKQKYGGSFNDELDAAKRVNQLCEELGIPLLHPEISAKPNQQYQFKKKTSQYKGVYYDKHSGKWKVKVFLKGQKPKYGGIFNDELDAAKRVNQLCEELRISLLHPELSTIPNQQHQFKEKTSQYKGVYFERQPGKWKVQLSLKGQKQKYGGHFKSELEAAKRANQLCEEFGIPPQNPTISTILNQQYQSKQNSSQYKGVTYDKQTCKWNVLVYVKGQKQKYGGQFNNELDAAKRVNQFCKELGIPQKNPTISAMPNQQRNAKKKTSQYKGVCYLKQADKWYAGFHIKGQRSIYGGIFNDELDAGRKVNQLCDDFGIPQQNPGISGIQNQQYQHDDHQTANLVNSEILETDNDNAKKKKRKRQKQINDDDELSAEKYYFYDHLLK